MHEVPHHSVATHSVETRAKQGMAEIAAEVVRALTTSHVTPHPDDPHPETHVLADPRLSGRSKRVRSVLSILRGAGMLGRGTHVLDYRTAPVTLRALDRLVRLRALRLALVQCRILGIGAPTRDVAGALDALPSLYPILCSAGAPAFPRVSREFEVWQRYRGFVEGNYYVPTRGYAAEILRLCSLSQSWGFEAEFGCSPTSSEAEGCQGPCENGVAL